MPYWLYICIKIDTISSIMTLKNDTKNTEDGLLDLKFNIHYRMAKRTQVKKKAIMAFVQRQTKTSMATIKRHIYCKADDTYRVNYDIIKAFAQALKIEDITELENPTV